MKAQRVRFASLRQPIDHAPSPEVYTIRLGWIEDRDGLKLGCAVTLKGIKGWWRVDSLSESVFIAPHPDAVAVMGFNRGWKVGGLK